MRLLPDLVLTPEGWQRERAIAIADGRIAMVQAAGASQRGTWRCPGGAPARHGQQPLPHVSVALRGLGDDLDFMGWRDRVLYPYSTRLDREGIASARRSPSRDALQGVTTCVDFFYLQDEGNDNAEAVIRRRAQAGIRLVLARTMYDWDGAPSRYRETPADAARRVRELIGAHAGDDRHDPAGAAQPARRLARDDPGRIGGRGGGRTRAFTSTWPRGSTRAAHAAEHGATPIRYLDRLGVLGPRMIGVHCVWLDDQEVAPDGARAAPGWPTARGSNMFLGDGITRIPEMLRAGVRIGLGTDGGCTNNRLSVFDEMRTCSLLQRVRLLDGTVLSAETAFGLGTRAAAGLVGLEAGVIAAGQLADLVAIDLGHLSLQPRNDLLKSVVYAMSPQAVTDVWVHGRRVVEQGRLTTIAEDEVVARVAALTKGWAI